MFTENLCSTEFSKSQKKKNTEIRIAFKCFSLCSDRSVHYLTTPFRLQRLKSRNSKIIVNYESLMIWKEAVLPFCQSYLNTRLERLRKIFGSSGLLTCVSWLMTPIFSKQNVARLRRCTDILIVVSYNSVRIRNVIPKNDSRASRKLSFQ